MASKVIYETQTRFGSDLVEVFGYDKSSFFLYPIKKDGVAKIKIYPKNFESGITFLLGLFDKSSNFEQEIQKHVKPEFKLEKIKFEFNQVEITLDKNSDQNAVFNMYSKKREEMLNQFVNSQPY